MSEDNSFHRELFMGLKALSESSFPKKCANCGRTFQTAEQYLEETQDVSDSRTGLKQSENDDGSKIVEAFRNCPCGSTLMDVFCDRRDFSPTAERRRKRFGELLDILEKHGVARNVGRLELLKVMRGEKSELLSNIKSTTGSN